MTGARAPARRWRALACAAGLAMMPAGPAAAQAALSARAANAEVRDLLTSGETRFASGDYTGAAADLWNASTAQPGLFADAQVQLLRARAVALSGRPEAALRVLDRVEGEAGDLAAADRLREVVNNILTGQGDGEALRAELVTGQAQTRRERRAAEAAAPVATPGRLDDLRRGVRDARRAENDVAERGLLTQLYIAGYADAEEMARLTELAALRPSGDLEDDKYAAFLATTAGHLELAAAIYESVHWAGAGTSFDEAVVLTNLATIYVDLGRTDRALEAVEQATAADDSYANAWALRGLLLDSVNRSDEALPILEHAYRLGARNPLVSQRIAALQAAGVN